MTSFDIIKPSNQPQPNYVAKKPSRKRRLWIWLLVLLVFIASLGFVGASFVSKASKIFTNKENIFTRLGRLIVAEDKPLIGESDGQVNVLLLGYGGPGHDGAYLTDTMIVASLNLSTQDVVLTTIPRDFWVQLGDLGNSKINAAYAYNRSDSDPTLGGKAAVKAAEQVTGLRIPYFAAVYFQGFVDAVNNVGGLDIQIDNTFTDNEYPGENFSTIAVTFTKGTEHMSGERALIFARSRHGNNDEGSDFARSERQKKILLAFKDRVVKLKLADLKTLNNLLSDFTNNFRTNLEPYELKRFATLTENLNHDKVFSFSLEPQGNIICNNIIYLDPKTFAQVSAPEIPEPDSEIPETELTLDNPERIEEPGPIKAYVVQPCPGKNLSDIHRLVTNSPLIARLRKENASIEIQNSTGNKSAAASWQLLSDLGLNVSFTTFRGSTAFEQTIFYDNSSNSKPATMDYLKSNYKFRLSDIGYPSSTADFFVFLGKDAIP